MLGGLYILMAIMLVLGGLMARREPLAKLATTQVGPYHTNTAEG